MRRWIRLSASSNKKLLLRRRTTMITRMRNMMETKRAMTLKKVHVKRLALKVP